MVDLEPAAAPYAPIGDYALIGDCHGSALVRKDASIDWACLRRFDSGSIFGRLLDAERGGSFQLRARGPVTFSRRYLPDTNVLETLIFGPEGEARILDCFAMRGGGRTRPLRQILRRVEGVRGQVAFEVLIQPRFDYGSLHPWLRHHKREGVYSAVGGDDAIVLTSECPLETDRHAVAWRGGFELRAGQRRRFTLTATLPHDLALDRVPARSFDARLRTTLAWWRRWVKKGSRVVCADEVRRSALVLKLLTCAPTGAIVAAPTTSLPERIGGDRNWDYRYSWIRDSTMTLSALFSVGHPEVATGFKRFIETATAGKPDELQIMYGCYGERRLTELTLAGLDGYRGSRPVRVGNSAATQTQLDVYGELLDAASLWLRVSHGLTDDGWRFLRGLVDVACERWREPDRGLWEVRGEPQHFVYSKVMCWLAVARGIQIADEERLPCDRARWIATRDQIRKSVEQHGVDRERRCFVQAYGSHEVDACLLRLPIVGFVPPDDPRMRATLAAVREDLSMGPLVRRYRTQRTEDGLDGGEGAFLMASFWLVDVLAMSGELDEAERLYRELLTLSNEVGLFAEEYDPTRREQLGNFPQAFTHIALIAAAEQLRLSRKNGGAKKPLAHRPLKCHATGATAHHGRPRRCEG